MEFWLQIVVNGLLLGGVYALSALAFSLEWGILNIVNLAHGSFIMLGAYVTWMLFTSPLHLDPFASVPIDFAALAGLGFVMQRFLLNRVMRGEFFLTLLLTFGIDQVLVNVGILLWTADPRAVAPSYSSVSLAVGALTIPYTRLAVLIVALAITVVLARFMHHSRLGRAINATGMDLDAANLMGVRLPFVFALTMGLGCGLAGIAGALYSLNFPFSPQIGGDLTLRAFVVTCLGGLGNMYGPLLGGLALGMVESVATVVAGSGAVDATAFVILVLILALRPRGLSGRAAA
ncbi:MAG TPA: branched-chain amino acid ABC transporter permease [bacterium]|nr:branched-chain amino acid ABC transporter permease [bacterium]